jgi:general secretion pathway protein G
MTLPTGKNKFVLTRGFNITRLLIAVVVICASVALMVPPRRSDHMGVKVAVVRGDFSTLDVVISAYKSDTGGYPSGSNGLRDLIIRPDGVQHWKGPYFKDATALPVDPWGHPYVYEFPGRHTVNSYDLTSMGPDGRIGTDDDIANWKK